MKILIWVKRDTLSELFNFIKGTTDRYRHPVYNTGLMYGIDAAQVLVDYNDYVRVMDESHAGGY